MNIEKECVKAFNEGYGYEFIANNYPNMTTYQLKEVILSILGVTYDNLREEGYIAFQKRVVDEFAERDFGTDEED